MTEYCEIGDVQVWWAYLGGCGVNPPYHVDVRAYVAGVGWCWVYGEEYYSWEEAKRRWEELIDGFRNGKFAIEYREGRPNTVLS